MSVLQLIDARPGNDTGLHECKVVAIGKRVISQMARPAVADHAVADHAVADLRGS